MEGFVPFTDLLNDGDYAHYGTEPSEAYQTPIMESTPSSKPNQKPKGKNFNVDEDRLLVSAWLNISTDSKQGTNQTKGTFWTRVHTYYQNHRESLPERSQSSLLHRGGGGYSRRCEQVLWLYKPD
ncbi:hypothetical protein QOZ80_3BG0279970 [Eleusine coracana subsp. coracana]|nr:hypothetical protein QOZ80_3BG0279970 [Eleusine coracana subsp. coracana]